MSTTKPIFLSQLEFIPDHLSLQKEVTAKYGMDDDIAAQRADLGWSEEIYAGATQKDGLYDKLRAKGYLWSDAASKWFYLGESMPVTDAVIVMILLGKQKKSFEL